MNESLSPEQAGPSADRTDRPRWWQRVVPVAGLALIAVTLAAAFLPGVDDEVELSTQRSAQPFVELFMISRPASFCGRGQAKVRFRLKSHLAATEQLTYVVATDPKGKGQVHRKSRKVTISPGEEQTRQLRVSAPTDRAYTVTVRLIDRPEMLRVHCTGGRS